MSQQRIAKTVLISVPPTKGPHPHCRWVWRAVECEPQQRGYRSERNVEVLWESEYLYRPTTKSGRGKGPESEQYAREVAAHRQIELVSCTRLEGGAA